VFLPSLHATYEITLGTLAICLLLSGADDLIPAMLCLWAKVSPKSEAAPGATDSFERRTAIFVPCWQESGVIGDMVRHNLAAVRYANYDFFLGVYPNDEATVQAAGQLAAGLRNVHVAECPHAGPTSKADCLNWVYQRMLLFEEEHGVRFETVVVHDAEDLIHPDALALINERRSRFDMVQVPVLPLPTPVGELTHGIYCEDFAEYQSIDMRARQISGSFIPSNGVGTGYSRQALERMADSNSNRVFEPTSLTEDYESGIRIHALGFRQCFCPLMDKQSGFIATREYFPRNLRSAVRQRTRWVMGIALQSWERNGWRGSAVTRYWFWRDRKGVITNPLSLATNVFFIAGLVTWLWGSARHVEWIMQARSAIVNALCGATLVLQCVRLAVRMECVRRVFGLRFAAFVPLRAFHTNLLNTLATVQAVRRYVSAKLKRQPLVWLKTEHAYPNRETLVPRRRDLEEVLVTSGYVAPEVVHAVKNVVPADTDLADYLLHHGLLDQEQLCEALSLKEGVPAVFLDPLTVNRKIARTLPVQIVEELQLIPFRIESGTLHVAGPQVPRANFKDALQRFTRLKIEFHLVTWRNFEELKTLLV
jgi:bacteriophage N4 adsorption protein B